MTTHNWEVEFYETKSGRCPIQDFLGSLQAKDRVFAVRGLERLELFGPELRRPHVDYLRDDIYELRVQTPGGGLRLFYFFFDRRKIVMTHAIRKKTGQVPPAEIDRAIAYRSEYMEQQKRKVRG
jgi:phage-related protein